MYGKSLQKNWNQSFISSQIVENPELLQAMEKNNDEVLCEKTEHSEFSQPAKNGISEPIKPAATVFVPANKQIETRLPSGKRRITPMFLTPAPVTYVFTMVTRNLIMSIYFRDTLEIPKNNETNAFSSSSPTKSKIIVETIKESEVKKVQPTNTLSLPIK